jgi:hypothetical protein
MCLNMLSVSFALFLILICWLEVVQKTGVVVIVIATAYLVHVAYTMYTYLLTWLTWTVYWRALESGTTHMRCKLHQNANKFLQLANEQLMIHVRVISKAIQSPYVSQTVDDNVRLVTHVWEWIRALAIHSGKTWARQLFHLVQGLNGGMIESTKNRRLEGDAAKKGAVVVSRDVSFMGSRETLEVDEWVIVDPL